MTATLTDHLVTDDLTILLGLVAATVFLLNNLYKPQSLVHPILLGRQSDVARARNPGESAIYRNYSTGLLGRFPAKPGKDLNVVTDLVKAEIEGPRTLWSTKITNSQLQGRVTSIATGLVRLAGLQPNESRAFLLLNDGIEFILSDLALASLSIISYTASSTSILTTIFQQCRFQTIITNAAFLPQLWESVKGQSTTYTIITIGDVDDQTMAGVPSNVRILTFSDVERSGNSLEKAVASIPQPSDVFTISVHENTSGLIQEIQFSHENLIAGVAATRTLIPSAHPLTTLDTIVSAHPLNSIFGRVIAYTAIYDGTSFATLANDHGNEDLDHVLSYKRYSIPSPTLLFVKDGHLETVVSRIHEEASQALLYPIAMRHKKANIVEGFISKESLWDRLVFDAARAKILGEMATTLRSVIISNGFICGQVQTTSRIAFSVPLVNCFTCSAVAGPVLASHPYDLQDSGASHVGPPSVNVEVKLTGVDDEAVENGGDPTGFLVVRGPSVGRVIGCEESWTKTNGRFRVRTNGAFQSFVDM